MTVPLDNIIREIGHDGSEILWPDLPDPLCRRGFSIDEVIRWCYAHGFYCYLFERFDRVASCPRAEVRVFERPLDWYIPTTTGIILGTMKDTRNRHALTNIYGEIIDPQTSLTLDLSKVDLELYLLIKY